MNAPFGESGTVYGSGGRVLFALERLEQAGQPLALDVERQDLQRRDVHEPDALRGETTQRSVVDVVAEVAASVVAGAVVRKWTLRVALCEKAPL